MTTIAYQLGIDLGTTFTAAALVRDGRAEPVTLGNHGVAVPSVVFLGAEGGFLIGEAAVQRAAGEPERVAREFKRRLGDPTPILVGGVPVAAELLMARSLDWVVGQVTRTEGAPPAALAVTHPANWGEYKLDLLRQAIRHVGRHVDHFVPEPVAAARFYATQRRLAPGTVVAVYDLGGGTFDAAVVRVEDGGFALLGRPEGIERLGGVDFDAAVLGHVLDVLGIRREELDADDPALHAGLAVLRRDCVEAKEALSSDTDVAIPVMLPRVHTQVRLTRAELEDMVRPALDETIVALRRAIASSGVAVEDLAAVLLVGGSSRIPLVGRLVSAELQRPIAVDARPKDAIPMGAALVAAESPAAGPPTDPVPTGAATAMATTTAAESPAGPAPTGTPGTAAAGAAGTAGTPTAPGAPAQSGPAATASMATADAPAPSDAAGPADRSPGRDRPWPRVAVALAAVVAVVVVAVVAVVLRGGDGEGDGGDGDGSEQADAATPVRDYDPATDGPIADHFDLGGAPLVVGTDLLPEAELVGQITVQALEAAGAEPTPLTVPTTSTAIHDGLVSGEVDLAWDYSNDAWRDLVGDGQPPHDPDEMRDALNGAEDDAGNDVVWLDRTAFESRFTFVASAPVADERGLATYSDLGVLDGDADATLCSTEDPSLLVSAVEDAYDVRLPEWRQTDPADLLPQVGDGTCTLGVTVATNGAAARLGLVALEDDRQAQGAAHEALAVRAPILDAHPEIASLVAPIARALDHGTIRSLNARMEVDGARPADVAREWLVEEGFVARPAGPLLADEFDLAGAGFTLGSTGTAEQGLLTEITRQALVEAGAEAEVRPLEGGTGARDELLAGRLDLSWDYLAPTWVEHLGHATVGADADLLYDRVAAEDAANGVTWFAPAAFDRGWAIVTTRERAEDLEVSSIAGLDARRDDGAEAPLLCSEVNDTARGWIEEAYGFEITSFEVVDDDVEGRVDAGDCRFGMVRASSPWMVGLDLVVLDDPRTALPADRAAVAARPAVAEQHPQLAQLLAALGDALTDDTMRGLTNRVVADGEPPADVAGAWLREAGFVDG